MDVVKNVTGGTPNLPVKKEGAKTRYRPLKSGLWAKNIAKGVDKRTSIGRWIDRLRQELIGHAGGSPSICELILIDRICSKAVRCRLYEAGLLKNEVMGSRDHFLALENGLRHDLALLGLAKRPGKVKSLEDYMKEKAEGSR